MFSTDLGCVHSRSNFLLEKRIAYRQFTKFLQYSYVYLIVIQAENGYFYEVHI